MEVPTDRISKETGAIYFETDKVDRRLTGEDTEMQDVILYNLLLAAGFTRDPIC